MGKKRRGEIREIPEVHLLRVRGVLEGLALFDDKYVIRERMIAEKRIPPLHLIVYRTEESVPFEVLSVKSSLPQLQFDAGKATTSRTGVSNDCFETRVEVPARLTGDVGNSKGEITLFYRLRAAQGTRKVHALILQAQKDK